MLSRGRRATAHSPWYPFAMLVRVLTAAVGIPILVYAATSASLLALQLIASILAAGCAYELNVIEKVHRKLWAWIVPALTITIIVLPLEIENLATISALITTAIQIIFFAIVFAHLREVANTNVRVILLQNVAFFAPLITLVYMRRFELEQVAAKAPVGRSSVLLLFLCLWAGDTAAMVVGRAWGRHRLAPQISPGKTWEGASANLFVSVLGGWGLGVALGFPALYGVLVGLATGVFGQLGDLAESAWKRRHGVKDSGWLLPGHGGVLDRFDSLLFATPFVALIVYYFAK